MSIITRISTVFSRLQLAAARRPWSFFLVSVALLFALIVLSSFLRTPATTETEVTEVIKRSPAFVVGTDTAYAPTVARVRKESRIEIVALTSGQVRRVNAAPGSIVRNGTPIVIISTDDESRRRAIEREIALSDAETASRLAELDKKNRADRREIIRDTLSGDEEDIARRSIAREKIVSEGGLAIARLRAELTEKSTDSFAPKTFVSGTVEAVFVRPGDYVTPGTRLAVVRATAGATTLEATLDRALADLFDPRRPARLTVDGNTIELQTTSFSSDDVRDGLFEVRFTLSDTLRDRISDNAIVTLAVPLSASGDESLIPLESIAQDAGKERILVSREGTAEEITVSIRGLAGSFARVSPALPPSTAVLTNRSIIAGDQVSPFQN